MEILELKPAQLTRKILTILNQFTDTQRLTLSEARLIIDRQIKANHHTFVGYIDGEPIAIGSVIITERLIHCGGKVAMAEDIAVKKDEHSKGYGKMMVNHIVKFGRRKKCYKCVLACSDENIGFYIKAGFTRHFNEMRIDLKETE